MKSPTNKKRNVIIGAKNNERSIVYTFTIQDNKKGTLYWLYTIKHGSSWLFTIFYNFHLPHLIYITKRHVWEAKKKRSWHQKVSIYCFKLFKNVLFIALFFFFNFYLFLIFLKMGICWLILTARLNNEWIKMFLGMYLLFIR